MEHHRLLSPLEKIIQKGYNLAFLHGTGNRDCFYNDFPLGTLEASSSLKHFFLSERMDDVDYFIQVNDQKLLCFQQSDTECTKAFFAVEQEKDDFDDISLDDDREKADEAKELEKRAEENNSEFHCNILLLADKIKEKPGKTAVYFDNFEWTAGLYATNQDESLNLIKIIKELAKEKKAIVILNISDTNLLEPFHFNLEESNNIFIGNPSAKEVKSTFFRKYLRENQQESVPENLMTELEDIAQALAASNKDLRGCLRIYNSVMKKSPNQIIRKADFETAVEKILDEKISFKDVILRYETKQRIIREVDQFLESNDSKNFKKGLIFTGPPGTGKTFLAKALASEKNCFFMAPTLSDLKGEFVGETSGKVKRIFDQARANQPTILFIDEADTIFADRNLAGSTSDSFNLDMVNQFLVEIDGMTSGNQKIFIIAATNRIGFLDSAVRSRLSDPIEIPLPNKLERKELFHVKLQKHDFVFHGKSFAEEIAEKTANMSGRDIDNFVKSLVTIAFDSNIGKLKDLKDDEVTRNLFFQALKNSERALIDDMQRKIPLQIQHPGEIQKAYQDVIGYDDIKENISRQLSHISISHEEHAMEEKFHIVTPKGILLYGPPGNSKTVLASAAAKEHDLYFIKVLSKDFTSASEEVQLRNLELIFDQAIQLSNICDSAKGVLLFFDEVDALASQFNLSSVIRGTLLDYLANETGVRAKNSKVVVAAATNYYAHLDEAVIRKGRIDEHFCMDNPSEKHGQEILEMKNKEDSQIVEELTQEQLKSIYQATKLQVQEKEFQKLTPYSLNIEEFHNACANITRIRASGADLVDVYQKLKSTAYRMKKIDEGKLQIDEEVINKELPNTETIQEMRKYFQAN